MELTSRSSIKTNDDSTTKTNILQRLSTSGSTKRKSKGSLKVRKTKETNDVSLSDFNETNEKEERDSIVSSLRKDIVDSALEVIYEKYLEKQTVYFVSHCSGLAWKALIEWNYQSKDKGDFQESGVELLDTEPDPSPKDSWASHSVPVAARELPEVEVATTESQVASTENLESSKDLTKDLIETLRKSLQKTIVLNESKKKLSDKNEKKKVRISEEPKLSYNLNSTHHDEFRRLSQELPKHVVLQTKYFPSSRVDVQYAVMSSGRNQLQVKSPKVITIHLKQPVPEKKGEQND